MHVFVVQIRGFEFLQIQHDRDRKQQNARRQQDQVIGADLPHDLACEQRTERCPGARARGDEREQPARLLLAVEVRHEAPEHRQVHEAEQRDPDVERLVEQHAVRHERRPEVERDERHREEHVHDRHEQREAHARACPAVERDDESAEHELDVPQHADLGVRPVAGHRVAHGAQRVVRRHENEHEQERQHDGPDLGGLDHRRGTQDLRRAEDQHHGRDRRQQPERREIREIELVQQR